MPLEGSLVSSGAAEKASSAAQSCSTWAAEVAARSFRCLAVSTDSEPFTGMSGPGKVALKASILHWCIDILEKSTPVLLLIASYTE